jgi:CubicO group peptidase (beta-lactamase class C family)
MSTPLSEMMAKMRFLRLSEEFRRTFQYNSLAHHVLRTVLENLYGVSFTDYTRENLLEKLNMSDTVWDIANMPPIEHKGSPEGIHRWMLASRTKHDSDSVQSVWAKS